jgi:hypothetical protein
LLGVFSDSVKTTVQTKLKEFLTTHVGNLTEKINALALQYWPQMNKEKISSKSSSVSEFQELTQETFVESQDSTSTVIKIEEEEIVLIEQKQ